MISIDTVAHKHKHACGRLERARHGKLATAGLQCACVAPEAYHFT